MEYNSPYPVAHPAEAARIFPHTATKQDFSLLGTGATDALTMQAPPANSYILGGAGWIKTAITSGSGDTTGLEMSIGDAGSVAQAMAAVELVGVSAGAWIVGAQPTAPLPEVAAYVPIATLVPQGAGSEDLDDINAGEWLAVLFFMHLPSGGVLWDLATQGAAA